MYILIAKSPALIAFFLLCVIIETLLDKVDDSLKLSRALESKGDIHYE